MEIANIEVEKKEIHKYMVAMAGKECDLELTVK
jgi:hypothetical protein